MLTRTHRLREVLAHLLSAAAAGAGSADSDFTVAPHLVHMTFYTHPDPLQVSIMKGWITSVNEQGSAAGAVRTFENFSVPSLMGQLPWSPNGKEQLSSPDALLVYKSAANRSRGEYGLLQPNWQKALARWVEPLRPLFSNGTASGVFVGDEMGCGGSRVTPSNMTSVLRELRALVGPSVLLYSNDCVRSEGSSLHPKGGKPGMKYIVDLKTVPPELDLISMDCYGRPSYYNASTEVAWTKAYYRENIFPSLRPHQKVLLVPGTFGCHDLGLARSDDVVSEKLELYLQWAESDERIAGFNPWHLMDWNPAKPPEGSGHPCGMVAGAVSLPKTMRALRRIGAAIVNNSRSVLPACCPKNTTVKLTFEKPENVLNGLPEHADHFYTIPSSQLLPGDGTLSSASSRTTVFGAVMVNASGSMTSSVAVSSSNASGGGLPMTWSLLRGVTVGGQLFQHNDSCVHTLGAVYDQAGPAHLHGTFSPRREWTSNYSDSYCVSLDGVGLSKTRENRTVTFRGLPFSVIRITTGETGWARLPTSGRIIATPYVHVSENDLLHQPAQAFQCCLNWTCPCGRLNGEICQCPPRVPTACADGSFGPGVPAPAGHSPLGLCRNFSVVSFASDDNGYTWDFLSVVASNQQYPQFEEGPNENAVVATGSGDLLSVIRIEGGDGLPHMRHLPLLCARSTNGGASWTSSIMRKDIRSARPRLVQLADGITLLMAIRPTLSLWTSGDNGKSWSAEISIPQAHNSALPQGSPLRFCSEFAAASHIHKKDGSIVNETWMQTGYSSLVRVGTQRAMACYVREIEHSLPSQLEPPEGCREIGPLFCMQINAALQAH